MDDWTQLSEFYVQYFWFSDTRKERTRWAFQVDCMTQSWPHARAAIRVSFGWHLRVFRVKNMSSGISRGLLFVHAVILRKSADALYINDVLKRHFLLCKLMITNKWLTWRRPKIKQQYSTTLIQATSFTFACSVSSERKTTHTLTYTDNAAQLCVVCFVYVD